MRYAITVLISGNGGNLQAIIDAIAVGSLQAEIVHVISNNEKAKGLIRASMHGIPTSTFNTQCSDNCENYERELSQLILRASPNLVVLAGYMERLFPSTLQALAERRVAIINIHPSLLPEYKGLNTHARVLQDNRSEHGISIHYVDAGLDTGPLIAQRRIQVRADDTIDTLQQRVQALEHSLYPEVINWIACGRLTLTGGKVLLDAKRHPLQGLRDA